MLASYMWEEFYAKPLTMTLWWSTLIIHARYVTYSHMASSPPQMVVTTSRRRCHQGLSRDARQRERVLPGLDCSYLVLLMQRKVLKVHELLNILASHYLGPDHSLAEPPARKFWMCLATKCVATAVSRA